MVDSSNLLPLPSHARKSHTHTTIFPKSTLNSISAKVKGRQSTGNDEKLCGSIEALCTGTRRANPTPWHLIVLESYLFSQNSSFSEQGLGLGYELGLGLVSGIRVHRDMGSTMSTVYFVLSLLGNYTVEGAGGGESCVSTSIVCLSVRNFRKTEPRETAFFPAISWLA